MRITTKTNIAIIAMLHIAMGNKSGRLVTAQELADSGFVSLSYIEQIVARLREAELVEGARGPGGGYGLGKATDKITIADIVSAVTPEDLTPEVITDDVAPEVEAYMDINTRLWKFMNEITLAECVQRHMRAAA